MNSFYKFIEKLNESQEYFDELSQWLKNKGGHLLYIINESIPGYSMGRLILLYLQAEGKSEKEFLESLAIHNDQVTKRLYTKIYHASKHDLNTYLKTLYYDEINAEKNGERYNRLQMFLEGIFSYFTKKIDQKIIRSITRNFLKNFSIDELIDYITSNLPVDLKYNNDVDEEILLNNIYEKIDDAASNYMQDLLQSIFESGVGNE